MSLSLLQSLLGWCLVFNGVFYLIWVATVSWGREWVVRRHAEWFGVEPDRVRVTLYRLLAVYKMAILFFNFVPWLAVSVVAR